MKKKIYLSPSSQWANLYSAGNTNEAVMCNMICIEAQKELTRNGFEVLVGSNASTYQQRVAESNAWGADYHIAVHTNAGGGEGTTVFVHPKSLTDPVVREIYNSLSGLTPTRDRGIKENTSLYEINRTKAICVYTETEFHDDVNLATWIINNVAKIGQSIADGVCNGCSEKYVGGVSTPTTENETHNVTGNEYYRVQIGAFKQRSNAENLVTTLKGFGFDAIIKHY